MSFQNQVVLVTGAARGIGRACVEAFAREGAKVILNYLSSRAEAEAVAAACPDRIFPLQGDMSESNEIERLFDRAADAVGVPRILVNNAGIVNRQKFPEVDQQTFLNLLKVNTVGPYLVSREFVLRLRGESGVIVNIGSMRAYLPTTPDYSASKAALHNLTVSLAKTLAPNIRVNAVAPGFTDTDMHRESRDRLEKEGAVSPLRRYSTPGDIADAVLFLASDKARSITGQVMLVDNGRALPS
jgi:NAD(P)-dependent dehydrogenase (short-subunit alcohol dehydrogenase family)